MHIISTTAPGALRLARLREVSREARLRLQWMDYYEGHGRNAALTCRRFGISRQTFYRWRRRYRPWDLTTLESRSHRPRGLRQPTWSPELAQAALEFREQYPRWGKDKLVVLLHRQGWQVSTSMVGRILRRLKDRGVLREPVPNGISARRRAWCRPYAIRKPKGYEVKEPGDLVQVDTLDVRPLPGVALKHFTARDVVCRWDLVEVRSRATAATATGFLESLLARMPFPVQALQVDGGSEFQAPFEETCQKRGIRLFVLPPRSPKLNGCVERAQRTHTEEFYEVYDGDLEITTLNGALHRWERVYNHVRPHQALGYLTPYQFITRWQQQREEVMCH
jgi:putative transposase